MPIAPEISVVMSVYNGETHLEEAISSILGQTFSNFEFIIINDGSSDRSRQIIDKYAAMDSRVKPIHQKNMGLTKALNVGVGKSLGRYIARQDADDVSMPDRFEAQIKTMKDSPDIVLCGTWYQEIDDRMGARTMTPPIMDHELRPYVKYVNHFCHPSVMFVKAAFWKVGGYDESFAISQDFELWIRMSSVGKVMNIPEILLTRRIGFGGTISWKKRRQKVEIVKKVISKHFSSWRDINLLYSLRYYLPRIIYGYTPVIILKWGRKLRFNGNLLK